MSWDCSSTWSIADLRDVRARWQRREFPLVDATAVTFPTLCELFPPSADMLRTVFATSALPGSSSSGLAVEERADLVEILVALALTCAGDLGERLGFVFDLFDLDADGVLERDGVRGLLSCVARAAARLQLAPPLASSVETDVAAAAALRYRGRKAAAAIEEEEEEEEEEDDEFSGHARQLSRSEFVLFGEHDRVAKAFYNVLELGPRTRRLFRLYDLRLDSLGYLQALRDARPPWAIGHLGLKGTRGPADAQQTTFKLAEWLFEVAPFFASIGSNSYAIVLEARQQASLLVHVEEINPDGDENRQHRLGLVRPVWPKTPDAVALGGTDIERDAQMKAARAASVFTQDCAQHELCVVPLPPLKAGRRHVISMAATSSHFADATRVWSAEFAAPCSKPCPPDYIGAQARRREHGIVAVAVVVPEPDVRRQQKQMSLAASAADVVLHLGGAESLTANVAPYVDQLTRALFAAETERVKNQHGDAETCARLTFARVRDRVAKMIQAGHRNRFIAQGAVSLPCPRKDLSGGDGYDAKCVLSLATFLSDSRLRRPAHVFEGLVDHNNVRLISDVVESLIGELDDDGDDGTLLRHLAAHALSLVLRMIRRVEMQVSRLDLRSNTKPHLHTLGAMSIARLWEIWDGATSLTHVEARLATLLENVAAQEEGKPGRLMLLISSPFIPGAAAPPDETLSRDDESQLTVHRSCELTARVQAETLSNVSRSRASSDIGSLYKVRASLRAAVKFSTIESQKRASASLLYRLYGLDDDDDNDDTGTLDETPHDPCSVRPSALERQRILLALLEWCHKRDGRDVVLVGVNSKHRLSVCEIGFTDAEGRALDVKCPVIRELLVAGADAGPEDLRPSGDVTGRLDSTFDARSLAWQRVTDVYLVYGSAPVIVASDKESADAVFLEESKSGTQERRGLAIVLPSPPPRAPRLVVGPIIGAVSATTTIILLEVDLPIKVRIELTPLSQQADEHTKPRDASHACVPSQQEEQSTPWRFESPRVKEVVASLKAERPTAVRATGLHPCTRYHYVVHGITSGNPPYGRFRTAAPWPHAISILALQSPRVGEWVDAGGQERRARARVARVERLVTQTDKCINLLRKRKAALNSNIAHAPQIEALTGDSQSHVNALFDVESEHDEDDVAPKSLIMQQNETHPKELIDAIEAELAAQSAKLQSFLDQLPQLRKSASSLEKELSFSARLYNKRIDAFWEFAGQAATETSSKDEKHELPCWMYPALTESGATAATSRNLHSSRPDVEVVVHIGAPFSPEVIGDVRRALAVVDEGQTGDEKLTARRAAYNLVRGAIRETWGRATARTALANGSHLLLGSLGDAVVMDLQFSVDANKTYEAAAICADVLNEYVTAILGKDQHVAQDDEQYLDAFIRAERRTMDERGILDFTRRDSDGLHIQRWGSIGLLFVKLATMAARTEILPSETEAWLSKVLELDSAKSRLTTLLVVTDLPLFQPKLLPASTCVSELFCPIYRREASAEQALIRILNAWCSQAPKGVTRVFRVVSSESAVNPDEARLNGLHVATTHANHDEEDNFPETVIPHRKLPSAAIFCRDMDAQPDGGAQKKEHDHEYAVLRCIAHPRYPVVRSELVPSSKARKNSYGRLSLGPVVGEVTPHSAIILVEVSAPSIVVLDVRRVAFGRTEDDRQLIRCAPANTPVTLYVDELLPDALYEYAVTVDEPRDANDIPESLITGNQRDEIIKDAVDLSGLWGTTHEGRQEGHFRTLALRPAIFRIAAVRGALLDPGWLNEVGASSNFFAQVACDAAMRRTPSTCAAALDVAKSELCAAYPWPAVVAHGRMPNLPLSLVVHFAGPWREAYLDTSEEVLPHKQSDVVVSRALDEEAADHFRDEFRVAWGAPYVREIARCIPQLCAASPAMVTFAAIKAATSRRQFKKDEKSLSFNANASVAAAQYQGALLLGSSKSQHDLGKYAYADEASVLAAVSADTSKLTSLEKEATEDTQIFSPTRAATRPTRSTFRCYGSIGVLVFDSPPPPGVLPETLDPSSQRPFRTAQWALLEHAQRVPDINILVICCDRPILPEPSMWPRSGSTVDVGIAESTEDDGVAESKGEETMVNFYEDPDALRFIDSICEWLGYPSCESQSKAATLLCGGSRYSFKAVIYDRRQKCHFEQICIGALPEEDVRFSPLRGTLIGRYDFEYSISGSVASASGSKRLQFASRPHPPGEGSLAGTFAIATVLADVTRSRITTNLSPLAPPGVGGREAALVVGPVLGPFVMTHVDGVTRATATFLLEIDDATLVTCVCQDVLTAETFSGAGMVPAHRPRTIQVPFLRLGRRYLIRIVVNGRDLVSEKLSDVATNDSTLTITDDDPNDRELFTSEVEHYRQLAFFFHTPEDVDFNVCVISGHKPTERTLSGSDVLEDTASRLSEPWHGIDLNLHVGARSSFVTAVHEAAFSLYLDRQTQQQESDDDSAALSNAAEERVLERFRDEYRSAWSVPSMRACLAGAPNLMTGCTRTLLAGAGSRPATLAKQDDAKWHNTVLRVIRLSQKVSFEYERQLWDHKGWSTRGKGRASEGGLVMLHGGSIGVFVLDLGDGADDPACAQMSGQRCEVRLMSEVQRESLSAALSQHAIAVMILVIECALFKPLEDAVANQVRWEFRENDQTWIAEKLLKWRSARSGRDVKVICGVGGGQLGWGAGLRTNLSIDLRKPPLEQLVIGPITDRPRETRASELSGKVGKVAFTHEPRSMRHVAVLELTAERLVDDAGKHTIMGSCEASPPIVAINPPLTVARGRETARPNTWRLPAEWQEIANLDVAVDPGFVHESVWYALNQDPAIEAMRLYVGGGGHGPGDARFASVVKHAYKSSTMNEFRKAPELREHLTEIAGPVFTHKLRIVLVELYRSLPFAHRATLARLDDVFVGRAVVARASAEKEPPMTFEIWHDFVSRCFSLAAALRLAVLTHAAKREKVARAFPPTLTTSEEDESERDVVDDEQDFQTKMNILAENDREEYERHMDEMRRRTAKKAAQQDEDPAAKRHRLILVRKEGRRRARDPPVPDSNGFADRPLTEEEEAKMRKQKVKHARKEAAKKRLDKYKKRRAAAAS